MIGEGAFRPSWAPRVGTQLLVGVAALATAALAGYVIFHEPLFVAAVFCVLPLLVWFLARPGPAIVLLGATLPITYSITGGSGGVNLAPSDLILAFLAAAIFFEAVAHDGSPPALALRPLKRPLLQYSAFLVALFVVHLGVHDALQTAQRFELFLVPLLVGAVAALRDRHVTVLKAYVIGACVLAAAWPFAHGLGQKNPVGQMIANAILLVVGLKTLSRLTPLLLVLVPGLVLTGSRGAILATALGALVMLALQDSRARAIAARLSVIAVVAFLTYAILPVSLQDRLTTFVPGTGSKGAYALTVRQHYAHDAYHLISTHPFLGVGVGNYLAGSLNLDTVTNDPHDVLLLQAAEGGYLFAVSFVLLIGGVLLQLRRMKETELAAVAAGVLVATLVHGLLDVYWVRGTPILGWLLVGMACGVIARRTGDARNNAIE